PEVGDFTHTASSATPHPLAADIFFPENLRQRVTPSDAMQEEERIAQIALAGSIRADEDRERSQFESRILEVLESFEVDGFDHDAQLPEGQWPVHSFPASF